MRSVVRLGKELRHPSSRSGSGSPAPRQQTRVGDLSGGERRRLQLTRLLMDEPNVLLLDEPTNDLDIETLTSLEDLLDAWAGTLVVVSHDRYLLERVCDGQVALLGDGRRRRRPTTSGCCVSTASCGDRRRARALEFRVASRSAEASPADPPALRPGRGPSSPVAARERRAGPDRLGGLGAPRLQAGRPAVAQEGGPRVRRATSRRSRHDQEPASEGGATGRSAGRDDLPVRDVDVERAGGEHVQRRTRPRGTRRSAPRGRGAPRRGSAGRGRVPGEGPDGGDGDESDEQALATSPAFAAAQPRQKSQGDDERGALQWGTAGERGLATTASRGRQAERQEQRSGSRAVAPRRRHDAVTTRSTKTADSMNQKRQSGPSRPRRRPS